VKRSALQLAWAVKRQLLQHSTYPVLCGPFRGEIGFECLYWIPFLKALGLSRDRLIPITRGGAHVWYPADRHVELYGLRTPKDLRIQQVLATQRTGILKQMSWNAYDRAIVKDAAKQLGLSHYMTLHPSWMYRRLEPFWFSQRGLVWLMQQIRVETLPGLTLEGVSLPESFVAVRFYARTTFPHSPITQDVVQAIVAHLAKQQPVVVMNPGLHVDDHVDFDLPTLDNVYQLRDLATITPENNLSVQSAVLSKAQGFVGTYGGLAQLALMYKKPTLSLYQDWKGTMIAHKHYADAIATQLGVTCQVLRMTEIPLLHAVLPHLTFQTAGTSSGG
jgi:hypothetical protein